MSEAGVRTSVERALRGMLWDQVPRDHRQDPRPFRVRQVVTGVVVLVGAGVPPLAHQVSRVLDHASAGVTPLLVLVTVVNGVAEELFFRGALYAAVPQHPVLVSTVAHTVATLATGNVMLGLAAILLGLVVGLERRASGGVLAPILTHVTWSTLLLFVLPLLF